jgi:hypothetical protein
MSNTRPSHDPEITFDNMLEESRKLTNELGLPKDIIIDIYSSETDWEFILKLDSLLEAAVRHVVMISMQGARVDRKIMSKFIDGLAMRGRTSLLNLLEGSGCDAMEIALIESVRRLRNAFAHDITVISHNLIDVICSRNDRSELIKNLCYVQNYDENDMIKRYRDDGKFLRFSIMHGTLIFLIVAYFGVVVRAKQRDAKR